MTSAMPSSIPTIRTAKPEDAAVAGQICYEAFFNITAAHRFPPYVPAPDAFQGLLSGLFSHPGFYCVIAESDGKIIGSNCMDERTVIAGIGPITVDPAAQNRGVGRLLMQAVLDRAEKQKFTGIRLVQAAYHNRSLSLYSTLGFNVREPLALMLGPALGAPLSGCSVRLALASDIEGCNRLCSTVHGHHRGGELADAIRQKAAVVVERHGRITGYGELAFFGHCVGESNADIQAIIASAETVPPPGFLVPTRNSELFRWCLANGLRVVEPMTLMSLGLYTEPAGAFLPSILY
jgi:predicted N-acetyltransferase YhbS